jgi:small subunit ribosomal protein S1
VIIEMTGDKQKVAFSIHDYNMKVAREEVSQFLAGEDSDGSTYKLGDSLKKS